MWTHFTSLKAFYLLVAKMYFLIKGTVAVHSYIKGTVAGSDFSTNYFFWC